LKAATVPVIKVPFFISHQGCPHRCVFCDQRIISSSAGALPTAGDILQKVAQWERSAKGRSLEVAYFGGTFSALPMGDQQKLLEPLQPLLKSGRVESVRVSTRPDAITPQVVRRLSDYGVRTIELGVQSMDDDVLELTGRGYDRSCVEQTIGWIMDGGLSVVAQLMPGLPGDSTEKSLMSLRQVIAAGVRQVRIYPVVVLAGTVLADMCRDGLYRPLELSEGIAISKRMLLHAMRNGVDVIRIGLQADEGLNTANILAGCWHPAFGQLVRSELFYDLLLQTLPCLGLENSVSIACHPGRVSDLLGHGRRNQLRLSDLGVELERIIADPELSPDAVVVHDINHHFKLSTLTDLDYGDFL